ncbi:MAG TPA: DnaA regulatory inactivator Hda [Rhodocyclaceae bacterium]
MSQLLLDLQLEQSPTLDNFVAGANAELVSRLLDLGEPDNFDILYAWGPEGSGRTHLLRAAASAAAERRPTKLVDGRAAEPDMNVPPGGLLIVDDVDALDADAQVALFRAYNAARLVGMAVLAAGSVPPLQLQLREDLRTRIGQSLIYEVKPLSDEEKSAALERHALQRGMRVDPSLVNYLLRHGRRDLPSLMAVLEALDRATLEQQRPATLPLLKEVMQFQFDPPAEEE